MAAVLTQVRESGGFTVAAPVFAELLAYPRVQPEFVQSFLESERIAIDFVLSEDVWREAGRRFAAYAERRRKSKDGHARRLVTDFLIGSHALLAADRLLTFDVPVYAKYFPELELIVPDLIG